MTYFCKQSWAKKLQYKNAPIAELFANRLRAITRDLIVEELGPVYQEIREEALSIALGEISEITSKEPEAKWTKRVNHSINGCISKIKKKIESNAPFAIEHRFDASCSWEF